MLVSLRWFKEFCEFPDEDTLINDLNRIGFEIEDVIKKGEGITNIVIGHIQSFTQHPDADRLRIARVDIGQDVPTQIVTAATNVQEGDKIPVSLPGATLAGGLKIKKSKLRGVESNGMMCSAVECGLTDTSPGVWVLPDDAPIGADFIDYAQLIDTVIDVCILPNRGDAMSLVGLAREVSALYNTPTLFDFSNELPTAGDSAISVELNTDFCNYYRAQRISNVVNSQSPVFWQTRLYYTGQRPLSWLIDITNIVMLETGQPLHAFDANGIERIGVDFAVKGNKVTLLNEKEYTLTESIPLINVNNTVAAVAGVMGADQFSVSDETTSIILESAHFDPVTVRKASKQLGVRSESSARFEKGVDANGLNLAVNRVAQLLGDSITLHQPVEAGTLSTSTTTIPFDLTQINDFLGTDFLLDDVEKRLSPLGFTINNDAISVPSWRRVDCQNWPDIAEEVCRFKGINDVKAKPIATVVPIRHNPLWALRKTLILNAANLGLTEVIPFPLSQTDVNNNQPQVLNPITPDLTTLRSNGIQSLINVAAFNATRHPMPCRLFNCGPTWDESGNESWRFSVLIQGSSHHEPHLNAHQVPIDFFDVKGIFEQLTQSFSSVLHIESGQSDWLHPGQTAAIKSGDNQIGVLGMLHPTVIQDNRLQATGIIEFNLNELVNIDCNPHYKLVSKYPATTRDTTYIMDQNVALGDVLKILNQHKPDLCNSIVLCGYYQKTNGEDINVSFRMTYQDDDQSLEMDAVNAVHKAFSESVINKLPCRFP